MIPKECRWRRVDAMCIFVDNSIGLKEILLENCKPIVVNVNEREIRCLNVLYDNIKWIQCPYCLLIAI